MSWRDLFYKSDDTNPKEVETETKKEVVVETVEEVEEVATFTPIGGETSIGIPTPGAGVVTDKYVDIFFNKLDSINIEGEDYYEYKKSLSALLKVKGMNELSAYVSAYSALEHRGLSYDILISSIDFYVLELNNEKETFKQAQSEKYENTVGIIDTEILKLTEANEAAAELIKANSIIIAEKSNIRNTNASELTTDQNNFDASLSHVVMAIENDKTKIDQYLKA